MTVRCVALVAGAIIALSVGTAAGQPFAYVAGQRDDPPGEPNSGAQTVSVVDTATNTIIDRIFTGAGCLCPNPDSIVMSPDGSRVYVTNELSENVAVIETATNTMSSTISVLTGPASVAVHPTSARLDVLHGSEPVSVWVINTATGTLLNAIELRCRTPEAWCSPRTEGGWTCPPSATTA